MRRRLPNQRLPDRYPKQSPSTCPAAFASIVRASPQPLAKGQMNPESRQSLRGPRGRGIAVSPQFPIRPPHCTTDVALRWRDATPRRRCPPPHSVRRTLRAVRLEGVWRGSWLPSMCGDEEAGCNRKWHQPEFLLRALTIGGTSDLDAHPLSSPLAASGGTSPFPDPHGRFT